MAIPKERALEAYKTMQKIRHFEKQASRSFAEGVVQGFIHLYIGEEAIATGVCMNLKKEDYITSTHRGHGHIIAKGADMKRMMAELCGRETGYCHGKGGSMHITDTDIGVLGANGIVGGGFTLACGAGITAQMKKNGAVCVCFFGDGATGVGAFHEAMNMASVWKLPVVFVCENNGYGISTACRRDKSYTNPSMACKTVADRALAYGMKAFVVDGNNVNEVYDRAKEAIEYAREGNGPVFLECNTYRWDTHFVGDTDNYRLPEDLAVWKEKCPIKIHGTYLKFMKMADDEQLKAIEKEAKAEVKEALKFAEESPFPAPETAVKDVYTDIVEEGR